MPEYIIQDDFFSPLTSPAIEAQGGFSSATTASPVDLDQPSTTKPSKRARRKPSTGNALRTPARSVRQSPAMKPQTRRRQPSLTLPADKIEALLAQSKQGTSLHPVSAQSNAPFTSNDSVSPEPLSEALMGPPPLPPAHSKSPSAQVESRNSANAPATPATLMRMPSKQASSADGLDGHILHDVMEEIVLPNPTQTQQKCTLPKIDTGKANEESDSTPTLSAKSAKFSATSTPRMAALKSQENLLADSNRSIKPDPRGARSNKKRQSTSSAVLSPALRPKISPSISPLVPASGTSCFPPTLILLTKLRSWYVSTIGRNKCDILGFEVELPKHH